MVCGIVSVRAADVYLRFKNLVLVIQGLSWFLDDHTELGLVSHDRYHTLFLLLLGVCDVPGHLEEEDSVLVVLQCLLFCKFEISCFISLGQ